ncbi:MAG: hypothetical protein DRP00_00290 [Candidatus Aenigmatarchaeota archaeon]|nr:MAG: hypothetical protein DRP00_00290 [Candidatus Aenigmarchaeota archaeon]
MFLGRKKTKELIENTLLKAVHLRMDIQTNKVSEKIKEIKNIFKPEKIAPKEREKIGEKNKRQAQEPQPAARVENVYREMESEIKRLVQDCRDYMERYRPENLRKRVKEYASKKLKEIAGQFEEKLLSIKKEKIVEKNIELLELLYNLSCDLEDDNYY